MKRTRPATLIVLVLIGGVVGFLVQLILAAASQPKLRPEYTLAITLLFIAVLIVALAVPVRRATRAAVRRHIDPFYATRVVVLAKASSIGGALLTGVAAGFLFELLVRAGSPSTDNFVRALMTLAASVALLVAGLVAEHLCTVPPDDDERGNGPQGARS
jgi:lysylphosphatidylglycerol synthetase-like protein (DUF2156 family)